MSSMHPVAVKLTALLPTTQPFSRLNASLDPVSTTLLCRDAQRVGGNFQGLQDALAGKRSTSHLQSTVHCASVQDEHLELAPCLKFTAANQHLLAIATAHLLPLSMPLDMHI